MLRTKRVTEESSETSPDAKGLKSASVPRRTTSGRTLTPSASLEQLAEIYDFEAHNRALETAFPRVVPEPVLIDNVTAVLERHGFTGSSAINLVSNCRDELCRPFTEYLDQKWGLPSFNIASLAGMVFCGRTGFKAAMAHAPVVDGKERYVFWVAPHIAYSGDNEVGKVWRPGRAKASTACGALLALLGEIKSQRVNLQLDPNDIEMTLLKQQIMSHLKYGTEPTLVELTYAVHECILSDVRRTAAAAVNLDAAEYVIISGIQVHAGFSQTMFWPGTMTKYTAQVCGCSVRCMRVLRVVCACPPCFLCFLSPPHARRLASCRQAGMHARLTHARFTHARTLHPRTHTRTHTRTLYARTHARATHAHTRTLIPPMGPPLRRVRQIYTPSTLHAFQNGSRRATSSSRWRSCWPCRTRSASAALRLRRGTANCSKPRRLARR